MVLVLSYFTDQGYGIDLIVLIKSMGYGYILETQQHFTSEDMFLSHIKWLITPSFVSHRLKIDFGVLFYSKSTFKKV